MSLVVLEQGIMEKHYEIQEARWAYEKKEKELKFQITDLEKKKGFLLADLDEQKVEIAESTLLAIHGYWRLTPLLVTLAIEDIAKGCEKLSYQYLGLKDYDGWSGQRSDHSYNHTPKHGVIVSSIGLRHPKKVLSSRDQEYCLYFLNQLLINRQLVATLTENENKMKLEVLSNG